jgi:hypothetical protein
LPRAVCARLFPPAGINPAGSSRRRRSRFLTARRALRRRGAMKPTTKGHPRMQISEFDEGDRELLIMALRYWRARRRDGVTRRTDPPAVNERIDLLLAKIAAATAAAAPDDRPSDSFF